MQTLKTLLTLLLCIMAHTSPLIAMKKGSQPASPAKRSRENSEMIDLTNLSLQSPEKKNCMVKNTTVTRTKRTLKWQEALVVGNNLPTLHPILTEEQEQVHVSPVAKAVYEDDVAMLNSILTRQPHDLLCLTTNIVESTPGATLLDIAADRQSYKCLEYFQKLLVLPIPKDNLQEHVARMLYLNPDQALLHAAQER